MVSKLFVYRPVKPFRAIPAEREILLFWNLAKNGLIFLKVKQWHKGKDQQWNQDTVPCVSRLRIPHMQYWVQPVLFLHRTSHMRGRGERGLVQCFCLVSQPVKSFWLAYSFLWPYAVLAIINNARDCFQLEKMRSVYSAILSAYLSATECSV